MKKHTGKIWRGLATTTASLLTITLGGSSIANARVDFINATLGTSSYKIEQGDSDSDGIYYESEFDNVEDLVKAKEQLAAEISSEGSVLFKNTDQTLPLDKSKEAVTLWGLNSHLPGTGGLIGSSVVADSEDGQIAYGIEEAMDERGFTVNETMKGFYASETGAPYYRKASFFGNEAPGHSLVPAFSASYNEADTYTVGEAPAELYTDDILESAKDTTAIVVLSRDSSEASDYSTNMKDPNGDSFDTPMSISAYEKEMIQLAKENSNGKVIVLINSDVPMEIQELKDDPEIGAILWTGLPGMNGFLGVCDVLSGDVNPSGHISDTYATSSVSAPAMTNFGLYTYTNASNAESGAELTEADKGDWYVVETEGIYIGYKYYETRYEDTVLDQGNAATTEGSSTGKAWNYVDEVTYPFGYGLSYTTFTQELESIDVISGEKGLAKVKVTNTGDVAGKDVIIVDDMIAAGGSMLDVAKQLKERKAGRVFVCTTFGLFTEGFEKFDEYYEKGYINKVITTNLTYLPAELYKKPYFVKADMSKFLALIIDSLNHDITIGAVMNPTDKIHALLEKYARGEQI